MFISVDCYSIKMHFLKEVFIVSILLIFLVGCQKNIKEENKIETVKAGSTVLIDYAAGYLNGTLFDTTFEEAAKAAGIYNPNRIYQPAQVVVGQGRIVMGVEEALIGMKEGEAKTVRIPPEKAYGSYRNDSIRQIPIRAFGNRTNGLEEGAAIMLRTQQGDIPVVITSIGETNITADFNHPLAGKTVTFAIILRDIQ